MSAPPPPPARPRAEPSTPEWTTRSLLRWMTERFRSRGVDAPRIVAEMLLAHVLGCERMRLYMEVDRPATEDELARLRALVVRASGHEPVQYLVGRASFFGRDFLVEPSTLIPQPCTEDLIGEVLAWHRRRRDPTPGLDETESHSRAAEPEGEEPDRPAPGPPAREPSPLLVADIGTGSGCIAVTLALQIPEARVVATDVVPAALDLARRNAERFGVADRIDLREGPLLEPLGASCFDVICSNPPYISDREWNEGEVQRAVREHVPESALRGGPDGLDLIRPLLAGAGGLLAEGGLLAIEIGHGQREAVLALAHAAPELEGARVVKDHEGLWRVLVAQKHGPQSDRTRSRSGNPTSRS